MTAELWSVYVATLTVYNGRMVVEPRDVAHMLALYKMSRAQFGDQEQSDHYADGAGYVAIAGALSKTE